MTFRSLLPASLALTLLLTACGGGADTGSKAAPAATGLTYTDPVGTGWRLVKDPSSTGTRLVLNLVGPADLRCRGVGFNLKAAEAVTFGKFPNTWHAEDTGLFELKNSDPGDFEVATPEPVFFATGVKAGNLLTVGIFQKDRRVSAKAVSTPALRIALQFKAGAGAPGDPVALAITKARMIPEDIGTVDGDFFELLAKSKMQDIPIAVGTLKLQ